MFLLPIHYWCVALEKYYATLSWLPWLQMINLLHFSWHFSMGNVVFGLLWWLSRKESAYQSRRRGFNTWVRKIPQRRKWQRTPVFLPGESHGWRRLAGYSPCGRKALNTAEQLTFHFHDYFTVSVSASVCLHVFLHSFFIESLCWVVYLQSVAFLLLIHSSMLFQCLKAWEPYF